MAENAGHADEHAEIHQLRQGLEGRALITGLLVLSRFAGAAQGLSDALLVNPVDAEEVAETLERALTMRLHERQTRWRRMLDRLETQDVTAWRNASLH